MSMISDKIRAYVNDQDVSDHYGEWGALRRDQRRLIRKLCDTCDGFERAADYFARKRDEIAREIFEEIEKHIGMIKVDSTNADIRYGANYAIDCCVLPVLAELKRKYKEEKT